MVEVLSSMILNYTENGIIPEFKHRWWRKSPSECPSKGNKMKEKRRALTIQDVFGLFVSFSAGICIAIAAGITEYVTRCSLAHKSVSTVRHD